MPLDWATFVKRAAPLAASVGVALLSASITANLSPPWRSWVVSIGVGLVAWAISQRLFGAFVPEPQVVQEACATATNRAFEARVRAIRKRDVEPVSVLKALLGETATFTAVTMRGEMTDLAPGDMMLSVNSCDVCDGRVLASGTVHDYLAAQREACCRGVLVRRLFRLSAAGLEGLAARLADPVDRPRLFHNLLQPLLEHVKLGFDVTLHLCADPESYNPRLDYVVIFKQGIPEAFVTAEPQNWKLDANSKPMYSGVRTRHATVVAVLLEDRFPARVDSHVNLSTFCRTLHQLITSRIAARLDGEQSAVQLSENAVTLTQIQCILTAIAGAYRDHILTVARSVGEDFAWLDGKSKGSEAPQERPPEKSHKEAVTQDAAARGTTVVSAQPAEAGAIAELNPGDAR